jgi:hypothetical protein
MFTFHVMVLCRDWEVSGLLEQPPKLWLWSKTHGSICVQKGEPIARGLGGNRPTPAASAARLDASSGRFASSEMM